MSRQSRAKIFREFRAKDDSHLYPIFGKFNATERAIRRLRKFEREYGESLDGLELELWLEAEISKIVNAE